MRSQGRSPARRLRTTAPRSLPRPAPRPAPPRPAPRGRRTWNNEEPGRLRAGSAGHTCAVTWVRTARVARRHQAAPRCREGPFPLVSGPSGPTASLPAGDPGSRPREAQPAKGRGNHGDPETRPAPPGFPPGEGRRRGDEPLTGAMKGSLPAARSEAEAGAAHPGGQRPGRCSRLPAPQPKARGGGGSGGNGSREVQEGWLPGGGGRKRGHRRLPRLPRLPQDVRERRDEDGVRSRAPRAGFRELVCCGPWVSHRWDGWL